MKPWVLFFGFLIIFVGYYTKSAIVDVVGLILIAYGVFSKQKIKEKK